MLSAHRSSRKAIFASARPGHSSSHMTLVAHTHHSSQRQMCKLRPLALVVLVSELGQVQVPELVLALVPELELVPGPV